MRRCLLLIVAIACSAKAPNGAPPAEAPHAVPAAINDPPPAGPPALPATPADPREIALSKAVAHLLEEDHLLHKPIDATISREAFAAYMDRLDGEKVFLLKSDREALARHADHIGDEMRAGSLELAHEGERIFLARIDVVDKLVQELLAQPMNHDDEEFVETDPKKVEPAATEDELRDRWRKRLELQVLERVGQMEDRLDKVAKLKAKAGPKPKSGDTGSDTEEDRTMPVAEIPATPEEREAKARTELAKQYAGRFARLRHPEPIDAASDLVNAVTSTFDPHTDYLPPADKQNFDIHMSGSLEGIGASLRERDHYIEVVDLVPGGAAWRHGGLGPGDLITAVQNEGKDVVDVVDMRLDDVVQMIRGPKGTIVHLHVQKPDGHEETLAITRDVIVIEEAYARAALLARKGKTYGYIHLPEFYGGPNPGARMASQDIHRLLGELRARKVNGIVLDIRENGGGYLQDAVKLTGEFIDEGPVVQVRNNEGEQEVLSDKQAGADFDGPMIVLVDRFSASASEILAGALQDYHRAVIVGQQTHGKGTVQTLVDLDHVVGSKDDLGDLKLTIEQFFRVSGSSTQLEGVKPDITLPDRVGYLDLGEGKLDHAIAWSKIDEAKHVDWKGTWNIGKLAELSAARVAKDPLLSKIASSNKVLRAEREDTRMPLAKTAWEKRHHDLDTALEATSTDTKKLSPELAVTTIDDAATPTVAPGPGVKVDDRATRWRDGLARDPWVAECVAILGDMAAR
ncbi:MAG TPA: carboxy terminal-processing peptidase [Kofleriaceae bacterium]|nr:carboxy terminal-processing peptidase [Kofleriaceae bacterium]